MLISSRIDQCRPNSRRGAHYRAIKAGCPKKKSLKPKCDEEQCADFRRGDPPRCMYVLRTAREWVERKRRENEGGELA